MAISANEFMGAPETPLAAGVSIFELVLQTVSLNFRSSVQSVSDSWDCYARNPSRKPDDTSRTQ